jgi:hypothetical protein
MLRLTGAMLTLGLLIGSQATAQPKSGGLLNDVQNRQVIKAGAYRAEIASAAAEKDPAKAAFQLRQILAQLESDIELKDVDRRSLSGLVRDYLKLMGASATANPPPVRPVPVEPARPAARLTERDRRDLETELKQIQALEGQGRLREAAFRADTLAARFPNMVELQQIQQMLQTRTGLAGSRELRDKIVRTVEALNDVERSAVPLARDIEFADNFAAISKIRREKYGDKMSKKEREILESLDSPITQPIELKNVPFDEVMKYLQKDMNQPILISRAALQELGLTYEHPVSVSLPKGLTHRTVLKSILRDVGLTYIIKDEAIRVLSVRQAREETVVKVYPIDDLIRSGAGLNFNNFQFNPWLNNPFIQQQQEMFIAQQLIDLIQRTVEPASWDVNGGPGSISYYAPTRSLIIRNTAELHSVMGLGRSR